MKTLQTIVKIADAVVSIGLLTVGIYLFFWQQLWITGAIVIAVHSFYQASSVYCLKLLNN